jgi:flagellar protein FlbT
MALKVELKPGERIILGNCIVTNDNQRTRLFIEGDAPILREKDILTPETADTPARRIYLAVQLMYLSKDVPKFQDQYFELVGDFVRAAPSSLAMVDAVNNAILTNALYKALREAKNLIAFEQELMDHAARRASLREHSTEDSDPSRS